MFEKKAYYRIEPNRYIKLNPFFEKNNALCYIFI